MIYRTSPGHGQTQLDDQIDDLGGEYDPGLYRAARADTPRRRTLTALTESDLADYRHDGYLSIDALLTARELDDAKAGIDALISGEHPGFRGIQWERGIRGTVADLDLDQRRASVRKLMYYVEHDERLLALAQHPALLECAERILGAEPALFADQALLKPAGLGREKPWHQDKAYFDVRPGAPVVGFWIALDDTDAGNGCMHLIPGSHSGGPVVHVNRRDFQICDTDVRRAEVVSIPLPAGGGLIFDGMLHHGTPRNDSDRRRWALQLHYAPAEAIWRSKQERADYRERRLDAFGAEGKDVTC